MILSGKQITRLHLVANMISEKDQIQPCGVDFTLKKISLWENSGMIDFDNTKRKLADIDIVPFHNGQVILKQGGYLVEFNETVTMPLNIMGVLQTRSSLFRVGATIQAGVIDPGYEGAVGALLQVWNPAGTILTRNAKLGQWVFAEISDPDEKGYTGVYQKAKKII